MKVRLFSIDTARFASSGLCIIAEPCVRAWLSRVSAVIVTLHCSTVPEPRKRLLRSAVVDAMLRFWIRTARSGGGVVGVLELGSLVQGLRGW